MHMSLTWMNVVFVALLAGYCHVLKQWMSLAQVKAATIAHERRCMAGLAGHFTKVMTGNITTNFRTPETDPVSDIEIWASSRENLSLGCPTK